MIFSLLTILVQDQHLAQDRSWRKIAKELHETEKTQEKRKIMKKVTQYQAEQLCKIVRKFFHEEDEAYGPQVNMDFDWTGSGPHPALMWEGGPYDWPRLFLDADYEQGLSSDKLFLEPATSWALSIYRS